MTAPVLIVTLHPDPGSLCAGLADAYQQGAVSAGHRVLRHDLWRLAFDPDLGSGGYRALPPLEPDLALLRDDLLSARHMVMVAPLWWGGLPARAKGVFDRLLLPGLAFDPRQRRLGLPRPLLAGRSARLILTSDTAGWAFRLVYAQALRRQMARQIMAFVGIRPMAFTHFSPVLGSTPARRRGWLDTAHALGARAA